MNGWKQRIARLDDEARARGLLRHERTGRWVDPELGVVYGMRATTLLPITAVDQEGYVCVKREQCRAHTIVWETVHGPIPKGMVINHLNFVRTDNRISNLELTTHAGNSQHSQRAGRLHGATNPPRGSEHHNALITEDDVREIRSAKGSITCTRLAEQYGVSISTIKAIWARRIWRHLP